MEVREASKANIGKIVEVHLSAFPGFFLTELGEKFLTLYYECVLNSEDGILLSCFDEGNIIGFCAATTHSAGYNSRLIKHNFLKFALIGAKFCITKPGAIIRLANNLTKSGSTEDKGDYGELLSIGVSSEAQGKGVGKALLGKLEQSMSEVGVKRLSLTTDFEENEKTLRFYSSIGFKKLYEFVAYPRRRMYRLIKEL